MAYNLIYRQYCISFLFTQCFFSKIKLEFIFSRLKSTFDSMLVANLIMQSGLSSFDVKGYWPNKVRHYQWPCCYVGGSLIAFL